MAKNNSPLNHEQASWGHEDAERAKKLYSEGDDAHAHALGRDEFAADHGKWSGTSEHTGNSKWASGAPAMWESHSQIGKHMSSNLWGEAARELGDDPLERDLTGKRPQDPSVAAMPQKEKPKEQKWGGNKGEVKRSAPKDYPG